MRTAEELRENVKAMRERAGLSVRAVAKAIDMSASGYSHYEQRIKEPYLPMKIAVALADAFAQRGIPRSDVLNLAKAPEDEMVQVGVPKRIELGEAHPLDEPLVPVFDLAASAGDGSVIEDEAEVYSLAFPPSYLKKLTNSSPGNLAIISVKGESMVPTLQDDDIVLIDISKTNLNYDGLFVMRFNDALHVKRVGRAPKKGHVTIISDNKDLYPPMVAHVEEVEAIGKVLWYGRKV